MKLFLKIFTSLSIFFLISLIGSYDYRIEAIIGEIIYSLILLNLKENQKTKDYLILLAPIIIIEGGIRLFDFQETFLSLPPFIFKLIPFIIILIKIDYYKKITFFIIIFFTLIVNILFFDYWLNYCNFKTFSGKTDGIYCNHFTLKNHKNKKDSLIINETSGIVIIDFWTESCGVCYKKFPLVKELKESYKSNKKIQFITALNAKKLNYESIANEVDSLYNLETYIIPQSVCEKLKINSYPTIIVFNNNKIIFTGSVELLKIFLKDSDFKSIHSN